jgi:peptide/nickel transport system permease protein
LEESGCGDYVACEYYLVHTTLLLVIAITLALGKVLAGFVAVGLTMWVEVARVVRGQVISVKEMQYVTAARALGFGDFELF